MHGRRINARYARGVGVAEARRAGGLEYSPCIERSAEVADIGTIREALAIPIPVRAVDDGVRQTTLPVGNGGNLPATHEGSEQTGLRPTHIPKHGERRYMRAIEVRIAVIEVAAAAHDLGNRLEGAGRGIEAENVAHVVEEMGVSIGTVELDLPHGSGSEAAF